MKLHSDTLTAKDLHGAAEQARLVYGQDIFISEMRGFKARKRARGFVFYCASYSGNRLTNRSDGHRAASWTAWGWLLAELFRRDPNMTTDYYKDRADFIRSVKDHTPRGENLEFLSLIQERTAA